MTSLYIHIPFCAKKCYYCSFPVTVAREHRIDDYLDRLEEEARLHKKKKVKTIYVGGGTPALLKAEQCRRLLDMIRVNFDYSSKVEFTVEGNPENIDVSKAMLFLEEGVSRFSLGVQSFQNKYLRFLGRTHDAGTSLRAFCALQKAGFKNINLDLMCSFPGQTKDELKQDVRELIAMGSQHVSLYALSVEKNSRFYATKTLPKNPSVQARQYQYIVTALAKAGFCQYEVSNFSKKGKESRHNINTWRGGNYIGLGMGAHSHRNGYRSWNVSLFSDYMKRMKEGKAPMEGSETLTPQQRLTEAFLFGLRMNEGVDLGKLEKRFQCSLARDTMGRIEEFLNCGLLVEDDESIKASASGRLVLDELAAHLI